MSGLNRWQGIGNLGADPELRFTQGGQAVLNLRMACTEKYTDKEGKLQEITEWVNAVVWGKRAEALAKILGKGSRVYVEGALRTSSYEDKEGVKRYKTEVNTREIILCGGKGEGSEKREGSSGGSRGDGSQQRPASGKGQAPADDFGGGGYGGGNDDDIPF